MKVRSKPLSIFESNSVKDTLNFASDFSKLLKQGDVILLLGEIGAGKTTFLNGLIKGLGSNKRVISSSFSLMAIYNTPKFELVHFDFYRIKGNYEISEIMEYVESRKVIAIEWPYDIERYLIFLPYVIEIKIKDETKRKIKVVKYE